MHLVHFGALELILNHHFLFLIYIFNVMCENNNSGYSGEKIFSIPSITFHIAVLLCCQTVMGLVRLHEKTKAAVKKILQTNPGHRGSRHCKARIFSVTLYRWGGDVKQGLGVTESEPPLSFFVAALQLNLEPGFVSACSLLDIIMLPLLPEKVKLNFDCQL